LNFSLNPLTLIKKEKPLSISRVKQEKIFSLNINRGVKNPPSLFFILAAFLPILLLWILKKSFLNPVTGGTFPPYSKNEEVCTPPGKIHKGIALL